MRTLAEVRSRVAEVNQAKTINGLRIAQEALVYAFVEEIAKGMNQHHAARCARIILGREK